MLHNQTDEQLLAAVALKEAPAFAVLYDRYSQRMYRYFYRMLWQDAARSEDFTQDLFLKIIEKAHTFRHESTFKTWVYTMASNMCKNEFRRLSYRENANIPPAETAYEFLPETIDQTLFADELRTCINDLDLAFRTCFILRYQEELSVREICGITGLPEGTVKSRLHRGLQKVSEQLLKTGITR